MKIETEIPETYLSRNEQGWSLIKNGMPLCAVKSKENALQSALFLEFELPNVFWNGETGEFDTFHAAI